MKINPENIKTVPANNGRFKHQKWRSKPRPVSGYGEGGRAVLCLEYDDQCGNGHNSFSLGVEISTNSSRQRNDIEAWHHDAGESFSEFAHMEKWHMTNSDGPFGYPGSALYLAGNRDYNGLLKGEAKNYGVFVQIGTSPVRHGFARHKSFLNFLEEHNGEHLPIGSISHPPSDYDFGPKWTLGSYGDQWADCPFDSKREALEWQAALKMGLTFDREPVSWGEGKERELDAARRAAAWPEATDEELCQPKEVLRAALEARLPGLIAEFRRDLEAIGFQWEP